MESSVATTEQDMINPYEFFIKQEAIGRGSFGEIFKGIDKRTQKVIAIKEIDWKLLQEEIEVIQKEIQILSKCDSPYITKCYGFHTMGEKSWIVMEYLGGGSALDLMRVTTIDECHIAIIMREILQALNYLHEQQKFHGDVQAANILFSDMGDVKLGNFTVAGQLLQVKSKQSIYFSADYCVPPEVKKHKLFTSKADIWALGITAIELSLGKPLFPRMNLLRALDETEEDEPKLKHDTSALFKEFKNYCLVELHEDRPTAATLLKHDFILNAKKNAYLMDLIEKYKVWKMSVKSVPYGTDCDKHCQVVGDSNESCGSSKCDLTCKAGHFNINAQLEQQLASACSINSICCGDGNMLDTTEGCDSIICKGSLNMTEATKMCVDKTESVVYNGKIQFVNSREDNPADENDENVSEA